MAKPTTEAPATPNNLAGPLEVFTARAATRAYLWAQGEIADLHEAVDRLQHDAVQSGLVDQIGQDAVQAVMAAAFRAVRQRSVVSAVEMPEPTPPLNRAANSTVEALVYSLRGRGAAALAEPDTRRRLAGLSSVQVREIIARLIVLRPRYPAITDDLLLALGEQL